MGSDLLHADEHADRVPDRSLRDKGLWYKASVTRARIWAYVRD